MEKTAYNVNHRENKECEETNQSVERIKRISTGKIKIEGAIPGNDIYIYIRAKARRRMIKEKQRDVDNMNQ